MIINHIRCTQKAICTFHFLKNKNESSIRLSLNLLKYSQKYKNYKGCEVKKISHNVPSSDSEKTDSYTPQNANVIKCQ